MITHRKSRPFNRRLNEKSLKIRKFVYIFKLGPTVIDEHGLHGFPFEVQPDGIILTIVNLDQFSPPVCRDRVTLSLLTENGRRDFVFRVLDVNHIIPSDEYLFRGYICYLLPLFMDELPARMTDAENIVPLKRR